MEPKDEEKIIAEREFLKMKAMHEKSGYREGTVEGKDKTLQEGFNNGFEQGMNNAFEVGQLLGEISAYKAWFETHEYYKEESTLVETLQEMKDEIQNDKRQEDNRQQMIKANREKLNHIISSVDYKRDSK